MKREYTYTVHVIVDGGIAVDYWAEAYDRVIFDLREFIAAAVADYNDKARAAAEDAADMALEARKERQA